MEKSPERKAENILVSWSNSIMPKVEEGFEFHTFKDHSQAPKPCWCSCTLLDDDIAWVLLAQ